MSVKMDTKNILSETVYLFEENGLLLGANTLRYIILNDTEIKLLKDVNDMGFENFFQKNQHFCETSPIIKRLLSFLYVEKSFSYKAYLETRIESIRENINHNLNTISLHLTKACNLSCSYCIELINKSGYHSNQKNEMSWDTATNWIDFHLNSRRNPHFTFTGGEALLRFDFIKDLVEYIKRNAAQRNRRYRISVITNGTLLNRERVNFLKKYSINLCISFDMNRTVHEKVRLFKNGKSTYETIVENIRLSQSSGLDLMIRAVVTAQNYDIPKMAEEAKKLFGDIPLKFMFERNRKGHSALTDAVIEKMRKAFKEKECAIHSHFYDGYSEALDQKERSMKSLAMDYLCDFSNLVLEIDTDGKAYPCLSLFGKEDSVIADSVKNIDYSRLEEFATIPFQRKARNCIKCWARRLCGGGCIFQSYMTHRNLLETDPVICKYHQEIAKAAVLSKHHEVIGEIQNG